MAGIRCLAWEHDYELSFDGVPYHMTCVRCGESHQPTIPPECLMKPIACDDSIL